jgi:AcrR family transcriptional regulator
MKQSAVPTAAKRARNPRSGSRASSDRTRGDILEAAKQVLATQGYARFTLRQVASTAHISLGNLVYHYASKRDLVRALITQLMIEYRCRIDTFLHAATKSQSNDFASLVEWLMVDSISPATSRLFRELWVLALRDDFIAAAVNRFYEEMHVTAAARLKENFPNLTRQSALEIAHLMGIISEGANVLYGTARNPGTPLKRTVKLAASLLVKAAERG